MDAPSKSQVAAYDSGRAAFTAGQASTTCPFSQEDTGGLRTLWVRGYVHARRDAKVDA